MTYNPNYNGHRSLLTLQEREQIQILLSRNFNLSAIALAIGRSKNCIATEVRANGGRLLYDAQQAQIRRQKTMKSANEKKVIYNFKERIEALEMQIQILTDYIKEQTK